MAQRTVNHLYPTYADAVQAVADLTTLGVPVDDISLVESETDARLPQDVVLDSARNPVGAGATLGAAVGAGLGALQGIGAIALPYMDQLLLAGWFVTCLTLAGAGAVIGSLVGMVSSLGIRNKPAHSLATALQRGEHLVMVARVDERAVPQVEAALARRTAPDAINVGAARARLADLMGAAKVG